MAYESIGRVISTALLASMLIFSGCGGGSGGSGGSGGGSASNISPVADAGIDLVFNEQATVVLSAENSDDTDGVIVSFLWEQLSGPDITVESWEGESISFVAPNVESDFAYEFQVTVTDDKGASATDQVKVTVVPYAPISQLAIKFPYAGSRYFGKEISVVGSIDESRALVRGVKVVANAGAGEVSASIQENGVFKVQNLKLPETDQNLSIRIDAYQEGVLEKSTQINFENKPTLVSPLIDLDKANADKLFVLDSTSISNDRFFRVDLQTGSFEDLLGPNTRLPGQPMKIAHDFDRNRILVSNYHGNLIDYIDLNNFELGVLSGQSIGAGPIPDTIRDAAIDTQGNQILIIDETQEALFSVNLISGNRKIISANDSVGSGVSFSNPNRLAVDSENRKAYVYSNASLIEVDLDTGDRSVATSVSVGSGPTISDPYSMTFDPVRRAVVASLPWSDIYRIFVDSGDSENFSPNGQSGITAGYWSEVLFDDHYDRYLARDIGGWYSSTDSIFKIDTSTAERMTVFEQAVGGGPKVGQFNDFLLDDAESGYLLDYGAGSLQKLDLLTGERSEISGPGRGSGPALESPQKLAVDPVAGIAYVVQQWDSLDAPLQVLKIDLVTGDRVTIASDSVGSGPVLSSSNGIAFNPEMDQLYFADGGAGALIALNLSDLSREIISSAEVGSGEGFIEPAGIEFDSKSNRIFVSDGGLGGTDSARVFMIDPETGDRKTIYEWNVGAGPYMNGVGDIAVMPDLNELLIRADHDRIALLNIATGDRTIVADESTGHGEFLMNIRSVAVSDDGLVAYYTGYNHQALFAANLDSGDRVIISK